MGKIFKRTTILILSIFFIFLIGCNLGSLQTISDGPSVKVSGNAIINVGDTSKYSASVTPADKFSQIVTWTVSDDSIATINEDGTVTGIAAGRTTIKATYQDDKYSVIGRFSIKVIAEEKKYTDEVPENIKIYANTDVKVNTIAILRIETTPLNAKHDVIWESSNEELASVDSFGVVKYHGNEGTVTLSCKAIDDNSICDSIEINITNSTRNSDIEAATIDCIKNTKDSIFGIANYKTNERNVLVKSSLGSGFVYDIWGILEDGTQTYNLENENIVSYGYFMITNRHVVEESDELKVYIHMIDEEIDARLIQYDDKVDLAIVTFNYEEYIEPLTIADSDTLLAGQTAVAIGNPEGFNYSSSATSGIISYPVRYVSSDTDSDGVNDWDAAYIQHDVAINPGNSGGPLLNLYGQVIGVNTMKFASTDIDNMGFSIPTKDICDLIPYLENGVVPTRARIGVTVIAIRDLLASDYKNNPDYKYIIPEGVKTGIYVTEVTSESVADGIIYPDDIIIEFNGIQLKTSLQLRAELGSIVVGSNTVIKVVVIRNGEEMTVELTW